MGNPAPSCRRISATENTEVGGGGSGASAPDRRTRTTATRIRDGRPRRYRRTQKSWAASGGKARFERVQRSSRFRRNRPTPGARRTLGPPVARPTTHTRTASGVGTDLRAVRSRTQENPDDSRPQFRPGIGAFGEIALPPELAGPWPACGSAHVPYTNRRWGRDRSPSGPLQDAGKPRRLATAVQARNWRLRRNRLTGEACRRCRGQGGDCLDSEQGAGEFPFA